MWSVRIFDHSVRLLVLYLDRNSHLATFLWRSVLNGMEKHIWKAKSAVQILSLESGVRSSSNKKQYCARTYQIAVVKPVTSLRVLVLNADR